MRTEELHLGYQNHVNAFYCSDCKPWPNPTHLAQGILQNVRLLQVWGLTLTTLPAVFTCMRGLIYVRASKPVCVLVFVCALVHAGACERCIMESAIQTVPLGIRQPSSPGCSKPLI